MDDTISRQAAIKALRKGKPKETEYRGSCADSHGIGKLLQYESDISAVIALPSAQRKGKWIATQEWGGRNYSCSCCKFSFIVDTCMYEPMWNFCPNCGAEMKGEEDERIENS